ncbi:MAG: DUF3500 domain-containing protein [Pirellulaceae bacterium]
MTSYLPHVSGGRLDRRDFIKASGAAVAGSMLLGDTLLASPVEAVKKEGSPESLVKVLYETLNENQKKEVAFDWDHKDPVIGLMRTAVSANWHITDPEIASDYYTKEQQHLVREIFKGMVSEEWVEKFDKQLKDDAGGFGKHQNIAIFGTPGEGKFQFVMTGRHMTMRCDGDSADHVAFGGPMFYGHAADGGTEGPTHPGNVFWPQALAANEVYSMLDGKQQKEALVPKSPSESKVGFKGEKGPFMGIPVTELSADQKEGVQKTLQKLLEPYRQSDQDEVVAALKKHGGIDACRLAFFEDKDTGNDKVWDNWRLEGPSFVWHFRGSPHVHVWVNVADSPTVELNAL